MPSLAATDRRFFEAISDAIFTNPFDDARDVLDRLRAEGVDAVPASGAHPLTAAARAARARLDALDARGISHLHQLDGRDRTLYEHAYLFTVYDRFLDELDAAIVGQIESPEASITIDFADSLCEALQRRGIALGVARDWLALFFQLRRAFFFIGEALLGESEAMRRLRHALWNNVFTHDIRVYADHLRGRMEDFSTLLLGQTGTGKGAAAAAIGRSGYIPFDPTRKRFVESFTRSFVQTNLSQFPASLIESELFGHRRGAFTGAVERHDGLFERCSEHGALFLDEIGEIGAELQVKLLTVLQDRMFTPVGSRDSQRFAGRVIAATNRPVERLRDSGGFRDDFYYRLCSDVIEVPSLRTRLDERPEELELLVDFLVTRLVGQPVPELASGVVRALGASVPASYAWPGNVRELEQAVRRVLLSQRYAPVRGSAASSVEEQLVNGIEAGTLSASGVLALYGRTLHERLGSFEAVARSLGVDRRTATKYVRMAERGG